MARLSWNEIQDRAVEFSAKYKGETYEKGESQSFWSDFLYVFGIDRKRYGAFFEYAIKKNGGKQGFIDMFWPGKLLAEQKSAGRDLKKATTQAFDYLHSMPDHDLPQGIIVSDFANFQFIDMDSRIVTEFKLQDFHKNVQLFGFLIDKTSKKLAEENPVNRKAAEAMANLHNNLRDTGYSGHDLEVLLVRLVFCLFADDSDIFEQRSFENYFYNRTEIDGSDFGIHLHKMFEILNTPENTRSTLLDQDLQAFPYINGGLFAETIKTPDFNYSMRDALLKAMQLDWSQVSPAIFGSMFQGVMDEKQRRNLGAHYTSEKNILKVIKPLFLDDLYDEFAKVKHRKSELTKFHDKLATLTFLDPACGCGNFLVITYRELRKLEHKVIEALYGKNTGLFELGEYGVVKCDVDQMYGIEIEEFPSLIAETALWLADHQMNNEFSRQTEQVYRRIPLVKHANIHKANALTVPWENIIVPSKLNYILGNPPFVGKKEQSKQQKELILNTFNFVDGAGVLDFVAAWYVKALEIMHKNPKIQATLVSTNSITQGEQAGILWSYLLKQGVHINFAHRTFKWQNDAKGIAGVHCVIIGFALFDREIKYIYEYLNLKSEPIEDRVKNINQYLIDAPNVFIKNRSRPISSNAPLISYGSMPIDNGSLILSQEDANQLFGKYPNISNIIRLYVGGEEYINNKVRYCIWLNGIDPTNIKSYPEIMHRVDSNRNYRLSSTRPQTIQAAETPMLFGEIRQPQTNYLILPKVSSERRKYMPIGMLSSSIIANGSSLVIAGATLYDFAILQSNMHMSWMKNVCGRLESRYQYSAGIVYNNFIWPVQVSDTQKAEIEKNAQAVLDARAKYPEATLADLYDPLTMPQDLVKAHKTLDKAVDKLYQKETFSGDTERVALLFNLYQQKITTIKEGKK